MIRFGDELTMKNVLKLVSPYQIFKYYTPELNLGKVISSPFRTDNDPSFGLFIGKDSGEVLYNDLRGGNSGNWVSYLMKLYGLEFYDVLRMVNRDMNLQLMDFSNTTIKTQKITSKIVTDLKEEDKNKDLILNVRKRKWKQIDGNYWLPYGITSDLLGEETSPIITYWFNNWKSVLADELAYVYDFYFDGVIWRRKIYQPLSKTDKWKTNLNNLVIDGIKDIPKSGELLIITKSRKDRLVLKSLGYNAIATNNESSWIPDVNFEKLKHRFKRIVVFFDNDETGMTNSLKFAEKYEIDRIFITDFSEKIQDIADYRKEHGKQSTIKLLKQLL